MDFCFSGFGSGYKSGFQVRGKIHDLKTTRYGFTTLVSQSQSTEYREVADSVSDPYSFFPDPDPEVEARDQYGSGSGSNQDPGL